MLRLLITCVSLLLSLSLASPLRADVKADIANQVQPPLRAIYEARQFSPLWLENGKLSARANQMIGLINAAAEDGLRPSDYALTTPAEPISEAQQAAVDLALSRTALRYLSDLHLGRVSPDALGIATNMTAKRAAFPQRLQTALTATDVQAAVSALQPTLPQYATLRRLLAEYRALAKQHATAPTFPALPGKKLTPGMQWAGTPALANWLILLGDYLPSTSPTTELYDGAIVEGVKQFQLHHGQIPDGVIGQQTFDNLRVSLPDRAKQIELTMERLRWLDDNIIKQRFLLVNVPQFTLFAYAPDAEGRPQVSLQMPVVVGKSPKNQTPLMTKSLSSLVFSPYWNVPRSITVKEIMPKLNQDPFYLAHEDMELVDGGGAGRGSAVGDAEYNGILHGALRIRQRPGKKNALGELKFVFPNDDSIYMHDTPSKSFFAKERRDLSHGCVRVGNPMALALFALSPLGGWDEARVQQNIANSRDQHLPLKENMPVLLLYLTVNVDSDGKAVFLQDIYGQDEKLSAALAKKTY